LTTGTPLLQKVEMMVPKITEGKMILGTIITYVGPWRLQIAVAWED